MKQRVASKEEIALTQALSGKIATVIGASDPIIGAMAIANHMAIMAMFLSSVGKIDDKEFTPEEGFEFIVDLGRQWLEQHMKNEKLQEELKND